MKTGKAIRMILLTIGALVLGGMLFYWGTVYQFNKRLEEEFVSNGKGSVYEQREQLTLDGFVRINRCLEQWIPLEMDQIYYCMETNTDLHYYEDEDCTNLVKTIKKGTQIVVWGYPTEPYARLMETLFYYYNYGAVTYPTYQRGMRIAIPFLTEEEVARQEEPDYKIYYISKKELDRLYKRLKDEYPGVYEDVIALDEILYEKGYYISPDLYREYFPLPVKVMLLLVGGMVIFYGYRVYGKSRRGRTLIQSLAAGIMIAAFTACSPGKETPPGNIQSEYSKEAILSEINDFYQEQWRTGIMMGDKLWKTYRGTVAAYQVYSVGDEYIWVAFDDAGLGEVKDSFFLVREDFSLEQDPLKSFEKENGFVTDNLEYFCTGSLYFPTVEEIAFSDYEGKKDRLDELEKAVQYWYFTPEEEKPQGLSSIFHESVTFSHVWIMDFDQLTKQYHFLVFTTDGQVIQATAMEDNDWGSGFQFCEWPELIFSLSEVQDWADAEEKSRDAIFDQFVRHYRIFMEHIISRVENS